MNRAKVTRQRWRHLGRLIRSARRTYRTNQLWLVCGQESFGEYFCHINDVLELFGCYTLIESDIYLGPKQVSIWPLWKRYKMAVMVDDRRGFAALINGEATEHETRSVFSPPPNAHGRIKIC